MGNIKSLNRQGVTGTYSYDGNRLSGIAGWSDVPGIYEYNANGSVVKDGKGVTMTYTLLNLLATAVKTGVSLSYIYDATGNKLRKVSSGVIRNYIDGIEYNGAEIEIIHTEEGLARKSGTVYSYEYNLINHLGNVRYTFNKNPASGILTRLQQTNYYPFGKESFVAAGDNKYLYNGKELQQELGQLDYGARFYDPVTGRWNVVDPLAEKMRRHSPYNYTFNNPIRFVDPDGMAPGDPIELLLRRIPIVRAILNAITIHNDLNNRVKEFARKQSDGELRQTINKDALGLGITIVHNSNVDVGKVGSVPDLDGKSIKDADATLKDKGFKGGEPTEPKTDKEGKKTNEGGYRTYKNKDGSIVTVKPDGTVVRGTKPRYNLDGSRSNNGEKLIKTEEGFQATRDQQIIHENRDKYPEKVKL